METNNTEKGKPGRPLGAKSRRPRGQTHKCQNLTVRLTTEVYDRLWETSEQTRISMTRLIEMSLEKLFEEGIELRIGGRNHYDK
jgi:hypothetical protein